MTVTAAARGAAGSAAWADALLLSFAQGGYVQAHPSILQPAEPFLDLSGEDIRKSLYLTTDSSGEELCLRPDLTIPVSRDYLASPMAGKPMGFCYLGPVFHDRPGGPGEFLQAGIESFARSARDRSSGGNRTTAQSAARMTRTTSVKTSRPPLLSTTVTTDDDRVVDRRPRSLAISNRYDNLWRGFFARTGLHTRRDVRAVLACDDV